MTEPHQDPVTPPGATAWLPWVRAAAVLDTFDLAQLRPLGATGSAPDSFVRRVDPVEGGRSRLRERARIDALKDLHQGNAFRAAREANPGETVSPRQSMLDTWLMGGDVPWSTFGPSELRAAVQIAGWLEPLGLSNVPPRATLDAHLRVLERREPLEHVARDFRDRAPQLARLRAYLEKGGSPIVVHGVGGSGKSALVAKLLLEVAGDSRRIWAHLDLDDETVDPARPLTLILGLARQLGQQHADEAYVARLVVERLEQLSRSGSDDLQRAWDLAADLFGSVLSRRPLLLVIDTFEAAQVLGRSASAGVAAFARELIERHPNARVVLAGRVPVQGLARLAVGPLPQEHAVALLRERTTRPLSARVAQELIQRTGAHPLTIRLLADVLNREVEDLDRVLADLDSLEERLDQAQIQGFLFARLLNHLPQDRDLRVLAHASLAFVTFDRFLLEAIAPWCSVSTSRVPELMHQLEREVPFVVRDQRYNGWLRHRADLRERVEPLLRRSLSLENIDLHHLREVGLASLVGREGLPPAARWEGTDGPSPTERASRLLQQGQIDAAERAAIDALNSPHALAVDELTSLCVWVCDHLNRADLARRALRSRRAFDPLQRLRVQAAIASVRGRSRVPHSQKRLAQDWLALDEARRADNPVLLSRLAWLTKDRPIVVEALEVVGLPGLRDDHRGLLAAAVRSWDAKLHEVQSLRRRLELPEAASDLDGWKRALLAQGGSDPAKLLLRLMDAMEPTPEVITAIADLYRLRDIEAVTASGGVRIGAIDPPPRRAWPSSLSGPMLAGVHDLLSSAFESRELEGIAGRVLGPDIPIDWRRSRTHLAFDVLEAASSHGRLPDLLSELSSAKPSAGLERELWRALSPDDDDGARGA